MPGASARSAHGAIRSNPKELRVASMQQVNVPRRFAAPGARMPTGPRKSSAPQCRHASVATQELRLDHRQVAQRRGDHVLRHQRKGGGERVRCRRLRRQDGNRPVQPGAERRAWVEQVREAACRIEDEPVIAGRRQGAIDQVQRLPGMLWRGGVLQRDPARDAPPNGCRGRAPRPGRPAYGQCLRPAGDQPRGR